MKNKEEIQDRINSLKSNLGAFDINSPNYKMLLNCISHLQWVLENESKPQLSMKEIANLVQPSTPFCEEL